MINIYGIKNCDTMQKALKWLDKQNVVYTFHNYKETGLTKSTIDNWLKHLPLNKLINANSTTFRELPEEDRKAINDRKQAIALMMKHTSIIKRPVWDLGNGIFFLGWNEPELTKLILEPR